MRTAATSRCVLDVAPFRAPSRGRRCACLPCDRARSIDTLSWRPGNTTFGGLHQPGQTLSGERNAAVEPGQWIEHERERHDSPVPKPAPSTKAVLAPAAISSALEEPAPPFPVPVAVPAWPRRIEVPALSDVPPSRHGYQPAPENVRGRVARVTAPSSGVSGSRPPRHDVAGELQLPTTHARCRRYPTADCWLRPLVCGGEFRIPPATIPGWHPSTSKKRAASPASSSRRSPAWSAG